MARKKKIEAVEETSKDAEKDSVEPKQDIENWADKVDSKVYEKCENIPAIVKKAYKNREEADEAIEEYWNIYNANPDDNQMYQGNSKCYVPAVRDCINARAKRALKQNFPVKYKHVTAVGSDGEVPYPQLALQEFYIRKTKLKSLIRSLYVSGDVTGQWTLYVDWLRSIRNVEGMIKRNPVLQTIEGEDLDLEDLNEKEEVVEDQEIVDEHPTVTDIAVEDIAIIPPTCMDHEKADVVCVKLRMSKDQVRQMVDDGIFIIDSESDLGDWIDTQKGKEKINRPKKQADAAGVKTEGTNKYALIYEATVRVEFEKGKKSLAYVYFTDGEEIIGIIKAPQWGQKRPTISVPVDRISGSSYGISKIEAVKWLQWNLNDFWNMGQDSAMYSLLPIVMTDPEKNPNYASMVFGLAAVWSASPESTKFAEFPQLWKDSMGLCASIKQQIQESLDCQGIMQMASTSRKNAQAVGAQMQEQSVPILDHAERMEEEVLNELLDRFFEYDAQFREEDITVLTMGEIGVKAAMQTIPPQEWGNRYNFQWCGTDYVASVQRIQQQISMMNVLRGIPPQQLNGKKLDICPILEQITDTTFGSELSQRILIDERNQHTVPPDIEDQMLANGFDIEVHEADQDIEHLQSHLETAKKTGDPMGNIRNHAQKHMMQLQKKRQMAAPPPQGQPGIPGGAGPGVAGTPRMGAQSAPPQAAQNPPGAIHPDQMAGGMGRA